MASLTPKVPIFTLRLAIALTMMAGSASVARAQTPVPAGQLVDARLGLPLFPTTSWKDGFFLEHAYIADLGLHARVSVMYIQNPLGGSQQIDNRLAIYPGAMFSLIKMFEVGAVLPIAVWQSGEGYNLTSTALGDLRLLAKFKVPFLGHDGLPALAFSFAVGFPTGTANSSFSAQTWSWIPKVIIDWRPPFLKDRIHIGANLAAFIAGTGTACDPNSQPRDATGAVIPCPAPGQDTAAVAGLGNQFVYTVGASAILSPDSGFSLTTELVGSFAYSNNQAAVAPLLWDLGFRLLAANKLTLTGMYGRGLTNGSPGNVLMGQVGYAWEIAEKEKPKHPQIDVNVHTDSTNTVIMMPQTVIPGTVPPAVGPAEPEPDHVVVPAWQGPPPPPYVPGAPPIAPPMAPTMRQGGGGYYRGLDHGQEPVPPGRGPDGGMPPVAPTSPRGSGGQRGERRGPAMDSASPSGRTTNSVRVTGKDTKVTVEVPDDWWPKAK